jgi:NADH:ubiquinone oxidoreductase subunit F (NADH-binding)
MRARYAPSPPALSRHIYEFLQKLGTIVGSGGMIVMDESTNMVEVARLYMDFCRDESCGKCVPLNYMKVI